MYNFNYAEHYKIDAEKIDYFMERDEAILIYHFLV